MIGFTYAQLYQALQDWPVNPQANYLGNINRYIELGELRLVKDLNLDLFDQTNIQVVQPSNNVAVKPSELLSLRSMWAGVPTSYTPPDPYFAGVALLLTMDGSQGSQNFVDSSPNNYTVTVVNGSGPYPQANNPIIIETASTKFGTGALSNVNYLNYGSQAGPGPQSMLYVPVSAGTPLDFIGEDFTIEFWFEFVAPTTPAGEGGPSTSTFFFNPGGSYTSGVTDSFVINGAPYDPTNGYNVSTISVGNYSMPGTFTGTGGAVGSALALGTWHHCAVVQHGTAMYLFLDGQQVGTTGTTTPGSYAVQSTTALIIAAATRSNNVTTPFNMDEVRITKGKARYLSNFTPPTAPFPTSGTQGSIVMGQTFPVFKRNVDFIQNFSQDPTVFGPPRYYAELDSATWLLAPPTDQLYGLETRYIIRPQTIVTAGSSWLGDRCGDLLFQCALMEAEHYLKADDRFADIGADYATKLQKARTELRNTIRQGDYSPVKAAATPAQGTL
jgi:hypothetical protein